MKKRVGLTYSEDYKVAAYVNALDAAGLEVVQIEAKSARGLEGLDGLVLCGGIDLNPRLYDEPRHPEADEPNDARDQLEMRLLNQALAQDIPVLAICRGMQLFNVAAGGSLNQHIDARDIHQRYDLAKPIPVHNVEVVAGSELAKITGAGKVAVNSRHHQAVARLGEGLRVSARSEDGVIEAIEMPSKHFAVAVQWHPEDQAASDPVQAKLFKAFADSLPDN